VVEHGAPGQEHRMLEDDPDVGKGLAHDGVTYPDRAAAHRREARDQLEQGGLAAAARPYQGDELVLGDVERDALDRGDQVAATGPVGLLHALESDQDLAGRLATSSRAGDRSCRSPRAAPSA